MDGIMIQNRCNYDSKLIKRKTKVVNKSKFINLVVIDYCSSCPRLTL